MNRQPPSIRPPRREQRFAPPAASTRGEPFSTIDGQTLWMRPVRPDDVDAIIMQLDLVISVDTAVAHLAGALGRPCWVLLPYLKTDWRWLGERDDSPWYPGVLRLFRQPSAGDWLTPIQALRAALAERLSGA
mgnify:CR=1 FL=1